jgi:hypothetical protein
VMAFGSVDCVFAFPLHGVVLIYICTFTLPFLVIVAFVVESAIHFGVVLILLISLTNWQSRRGSLGCTALYSGGEE